MSNRILVVDDTKVLADGIAELLKMEGYDVSVAYNGMQAITLLQANTPDLIITDIGMPEMDGYEFIRLVRSGIVAPSVPIIIITADNTCEAEQKGFEVGASLFLAKPFNNDYLIDYLQKLWSNE